MSMGDTAAKNCAEFGWGSVGQVDPSLVADTSQSSRFGYGRAWSRSSSYALRGDSRSLYLVLTVEGGFEFTVDNERVSTAPGELVFLDGQDPTFASTLANTPTARYVWFMQPTLLNSRSLRFALHEPLGMSNKPLRSLIALTNTMLNGGSRMSPLGHERVGLAAEYLVAAALHEAPSITNTEAMHRDGVFTMAQTILEYHFRDPHFGVAELARELSLSPSRVHAAFAALGTTPRRELERRRLSAVDQVLLNSLPLSEVIRDAGFVSIRKYRAARARQQAASAHATARRTASESPIQG